MLLPNRQRDNCGEDQNEIHDNEDSLQLAHYTCRGRSNCAVSEHRAEEDSVRYACNAISKGVVHPRRQGSIPLLGVQLPSRAITMTDRNMSENPSVQLSGR